MCVQQPLTGRLSVCLSHFASACQCLFASQTASPSDHTLPLISPLLSLSSLLPSPTCHSSLSFRLLPPPSLLLCFLPLTQSFSPFFVLPHCPIFHFVSISLCVFLSPPSSLLSSSSFSLPSVPLPSQVIVYLSSASAARASRYHPPPHQTPSLLTSSFKPSHSHPHP